MNEISYCDVVNSSLEMVGYQGTKYTSVFQEFLDSIQWYNFPKNGECTWCCCANDYFIAINKGNLSYEQARQIVCESADHRYNIGAGAKEKASLYKNAGRWISASDVKKATTGDEIFFYKSGSSEIGHVGRIVGWDNKYLYTVEGSTTYDGKSNCFGKKSYPFKSTRIAGFGRPDWYKYQTAETPAAPSTYNGVSDQLLKDLAYKCIRGDFGNGLTRKQRINALGYGAIYSQVQNYVNMILRGQIK